MNRKGEEEVRKEGGRYRSGSEIEEEGWGERRMGRYRERDEEREEN